jgi:hypothetical protein
MVQASTLKTSALAILACAVLFGPAAAMDRHVQVVNDTHEAVTAFYASGAGSGDWEDDVLHSRGLPPGYQVRINLEDGSSECRFDFKTDFSDGTSIIRRDVNVCGLTRYTLTD